jgi:hypothetical protein
MTLPRKNIGTTDRIIRLMIGIVAFIGALFAESVLIAGVLALLGLFCLFQALTSWCLFYMLIGKRTCPIE